MDNIIDLKGKTKNMGLNEPMRIEKPKYPPGLSVSFEKEAIDALAIDFESMKVGSRIKWIGEALITGKNENESEQDGSQHRCLSMQFTKMGFPEEDEDRMQKGTKIIERMRREDL